jgi:hypothetical protein
VPKLSGFFGISIYVYWNEHGPAHFHARYAGEKAVSASRISPFSKGSYLLASWGSWWSGLLFTRMSYVRFGKRR